MNLVLDPLKAIFEFIFPVKKNELKKFFLLSILMFGILYIHATLRSLKDTIIVPNIGAEALSFIDLYLVLPFAILFTLVYTKISNIIPSEKIFYIIKFFFLTFFVAYCFLIYPNIHHLHPDPEHIENLVALNPKLKWLIKIYGKWTFALFGILVELWGPTVTVLMFWQFANRITTSEEARRIYPTLALLGNFALILAGSVVKDSAKHAKNVIVYNLGVVIGAIIFNIVIYFIANKLLASHKRQLPPKSNISVFKSLKVIMSSPYLLYIFLMVVAYGTINNMIEIQWKANIREVYSDQNSYAKFFGGFTQYMGYSSIIIMLFSSQILRRFSWRAAALATPIVIAVTSFFFFLALLNKDALEPWAYENFGISASKLIVIIGMCQVILMKANKYALFDSTKEMAFIAADEDIKTKGKAAVDVVGMRLSDTTGAAIQSFLLWFFPSALTFGMTFSIAIIAFIIVILWIYAVNNLSGMYTRLVKSKAE
ncbi:MAG: AAA family ATPase [Sphingobacteriia bacterium]|nr:AAA family ATPase [Sphingobacteriia bacterium]